MFTFTELLTEAEPLLVSTPAPDKWDFSTDNQDFQLRVSQLINGQRKSYKPKKAGAIVFSLWEAKGSKYSQKIPRISWPTRVIVTIAEIVGNLLADDKLSETVFLRIPSSTNINAAVRLTDRYLKLKAQRWEVLGAVNDGTDMTYITIVRKGTTSSLKPVFGEDTELTTRDFVVAANEEEAQKLMKKGNKIIRRMFNKTELADEEEEVEPIVKPIIEPEPKPIKPKPVKPEPITKPKPVKGFDEFGKKPEVTPVIADPLEKMADDINEMKAKLAAIPAGKTIYVLGDTASTMLGSVVLEAWLKRESNDTLDNSQLNYLTFMLYENISRRLDRAELQFAADMIFETVKVIADNASILWPGEEERIMDIVSKVADKIYLSIEKTSLKRNQVNIAAYHSVLREAAGNKSSKAKAQAQVNSTEMEPETSKRLAKGYTMAGLKSDLVEFHQLVNCKVTTPKLMRLKKETRASAGIGRGWLNTGTNFDRVTLWHEMGHFVEYENRWVLHAAREFLRRRANAAPKGNKPGIDDKFERLKVLDYGQGYGVEEIAINNRDFKPYYAGKVYSSAVNPKTGEMSTTDVNTVIRGIQACTEFVSMGFGALSNPRYMAKLHADDPEQLAFILAVVKRLNIEV